jgi:hypothetical protein
VSAFEAYWLALALTGAAVLLWGHRGLILAAAVMVAEAGACLLLTLATGFNAGAVATLAAPWPATAGALGFAAVHGSAAWLLLRDERHSAEVVVGGLYLALFLLDGVLVAGLWAHGVVSVARYLDWQAAAGWAQIAALAAGSVCDGPGQWITRRWFGNSVAVGAGGAAVVAAIAAGVAKAAGAA